MKIPAAICTSLILAAAQPFATAQGGAAPPATPASVGIGAGGPPPVILGGAPPSTTPPIGIGAGGPPAAIPGGGAPLPPTAPPAGIGAGGPPTIIIESAPLPTPTSGGGSIGGSGLPYPVPVAPVPKPPIRVKSEIRVAPAPGGMSGPIAGGAPMAGNPGSGFSTFPALPPGGVPSAAPAIPGMPGNAGNYPMAIPSAAPAPLPGGPGYHNKTNFFYEAVPAGTAALSPRTGQEIIRAAKLRVLERHYEETLNQMIQLEKEALSAPPEERTKMEASAQAMRAFLSKLEADLMPLADRPKPGRTGLGTPSPEPKPTPTEAAPGAFTPPPVLDPPKPETPDKLDPRGPSGPPGAATVDPTAPAKASTGEALRAAHEKLDRAYKLYREGAMSESDFIAAQRDFALAVAQGNSVKVAEARLTEAKQMLDLTARKYPRGVGSDAPLTDLDIARDRLQQAEKEVERARARAGAAQPGLQGM